MKVLDPGHEYLLGTLDGDMAVLLTFVKRQGDKYPGNVGSHPGTTIQEVLRALLERLRYVWGQEPCAETAQAAAHLRAALRLLEERAARKHGRTLEATDDELMYGPLCAACGHAGCKGGCARGHGADRAAEVLPG